MYMTPDNKDAYLDFPTPEARLETFKRLRPGDTPHLCPKCHGHGGYNLALNAYHMPQGKDDTSENRHRYVHFCASCTQCTGWGYTDEPTTCIHTWTKPKPIGNCLTCYTCSKCGITTTVDSSD